MFSETLYKIDATSQLRFWRIEVDDNTLRITHDLEFKRNSSLQHNESITFKSNIEAMAACKRRIRVQSLKGYTSQIPRDIPDYPMLARVYQDVPVDSLPEKMALQPKLDGMRCIGSSEGLTTRKRLSINCLPHIKEAVKKFDVVLDGEIYKHRYGFQQIMSAAKRDFPVQSSYEMEYHIYDIVDETLTFEERFKLLKELQPNFDKCLVLVETEFYDTFNTISLELHHERMITEGYEGSIIRDPNSLYEKSKRSKGLLKYKTTFDDWFKIVDIVGGKTNNKGRAIFVCDFYGKGTFECVPAFPDYFRKAILKNKQKYIGMSLHCTYFELTNDGKPRHAIGRELR
jgi:DNA ligase 1